MTIPEKITNLHALYCELTGMQIRLGLCDYMREHSWCEFINAGFTEHDLKSVILYLKRKIREGSRQPNALKFSNLIVQLDRLEEDLQLAKAEERNFKPPPTAKEKAVQQLRPVVVPMHPGEGQITAKPVGDYLRALREAAQ